MTGGKSRPKKDSMLKVSGGQVVKLGQLLCRGIASYKAGAHVAGKRDLVALASGKVHFTRKKTSHGRCRTFINVLAQ